MDQAEYDQWVRDNTGSITPESEYQFDMLPCWCVAMTSRLDGTVEVPPEHAAHVEARLS